MSLSIKSQLLLLTLFQILLSTSFVKAQDKEVATSVTIINYLQKSSDSEGRIMIKTDPKITELIGKPIQNSVDVLVEQEYEKVVGYRVQAFSGNDPKKSKSEAFSKQKLINETFPDTRTYVTYKSPIWRLRVGDFRTNEEAIVFMRQMKQTFSDFGKEMYVVKEEVKIPLNN